MEVEDWNEYGELKQHVKIVGNSNLVKPAIKKTENKKPVAKPATTVTDIAKNAASSITGAVPTSISLAMRQAGEQAAQTAKDMKKTVVKSFDGVGEAAPKKEAPTIKTTTFIPQPPSILVNAPTLMQSLTSSAWDRTPGEIVGSTNKALETRESMQSPTSSAWKSVPPRNEQPFEPQITRHRGSEVSLASAEEIKNIEDSETIKEEDEEAIV